MRRVPIRYVVLAALGAFVALPVAKVYTVGAPWIEKMEIRNNDLVGLQGKGVPGTQITISYRQRNFRPGCCPFLSFAAGECDLSACLGSHGHEYFELCSWLFGGNPVLLGSTVVSGAGTWRLQGLDTQVLPGAAAGRTCATGVLTQIELQSPNGAVSVPEVTYLQMAERNPEPGKQRIGGLIKYANQIAAGVADGPNDVQDAITPWTVDTDEDGVDTCESTGCAVPVHWALGGGGTFQPPSIQVRDDSPVIGARDQEFNHVMGMIQAHKPGGSVLAVAYVPRPTPLGPVININVNISSDLGGLGCDSSGGYFDFFP